MPFPEAQLQQQQQQTTQQLQLQTAHDAAISAIA
jgi:hypothetical protein